MTPPLVVLYALADQEERLHAHLETARKHAERSGWTTVNVHFDLLVPGLTVTAPQRRGWAAVRTALVGGFATGVVAASREAIATGAPEYEHLCTWCLHRCCFIELAAI